MEGHASSDIYEVQDWNWSNMQYILLGIKIIIYVILVTIAQNVVSRFYRIKCYMIKEYKEIISSILQNGVIKYFLFIFHFRCLFIFAN